MTELEAIIERYVMWLVGESSPGGDAAAIAEIEDLLDALTLVGGSHYMLIRIAQLVLAAVRETASRALRNMPTPTPEGETDAYRLYREARLKDRPVLWPPAHEYATRCLPGPHKHAVVSVPTGSGKGMLAELGSVHAALEGWVIYLVPTNALANQVRSDLRAAMAEAGHFGVQAFLGGQEYTALETEAVTAVSPGTVVVMTPEKCSLALRRSSGAFRSLKLIVLDECHLLGEPGTRGVTTELVMSHLLVAAPKAKVLMMSALVENPQHLAAWLEAVTGVEAVAMGVPWRPTRTLRGIVGVRRADADAGAQRAAEELANLPDRRVNLPFKSRLRVAANLQGPWASQDERDYALVDLDLPADLIVRRTRDRSGNWAYSAAVPSGYTNSTVARLSAYLANRGERVLCFVPRSKHDPFVLARRIAKEGFEASLSGPSWQRDVVLAHFSCARYELGTSSEVEELTRRGLCVHSSALLDPERHAVEMVFGEAMVPMMVATGTLAQGLNLPATAVLVAGTRMGAESRSSAQGAMRVRQQLLNAIGRAGRAAVSNHGLALVVPNDLVRFDAPRDSLRAAEAADFLKYEDASTPITSRIRTFVEAALGGYLISGALTVEEMTAYTYLPAESDSASTESILARSFGVWEALGPRGFEAAIRVTDAVQALGAQFLSTADAPNWTAEVAHRAGVPLPIVFGLYHAARSQPKPASDASLRSLVLYVVRCLSGLPPEMAARALWSSDYLGIPAPTPGLTFTSIGHVPPQLGRAREQAWASLAATVDVYLRGASLAEVAVPLLGLSGATADSRRNAGHLPIPKTITATRYLQERLSMIAGVVAALFDVGRESAADDDYWSLPPNIHDLLQMTPLALRAGCGSVGSLAWFRFGIRYRRPAHLMARLFPLPDDLQSDEARRTWVEEVRRQWLRGGILSGRALGEEERNVVLALQTLFRTRRV